jgi:large subunit ribosomal protein L19
MDFRAGDTVRVHYKIKEGEGHRIQAFEGLVLCIKGEQDSKTFTVRHIGPEHVGVERIFPVKSPNLDKVEVIQKGKVRRSKVYFVRGLSEKEVKKKLS